MLRIAQVDLLKANKRGAQSTKQLHRPFEFNMHDDTHFNVCVVSLQLTLYRTIRFHEMEQKT